MGSDTGFDDGSSNRRRWPRETGKVRQLLLWAGDALQDGVVLDESVGGIALSLRDGTIVRVGQMVRLTRGDRSAPAIVKHVYQSEDGKYHLGLEWGGANDGPCEAKCASLLSLLSHE